MDMPRGTQLHNSQWDTWARCTGIFYAVGGIFNYSPQASH